MLTVIGRGCIVSSCPLWDSNPAHQPITGRSHDYTRPVVYTVRYRQKSRWRASTGLSSAGLLPALYALRTRLQGRSWISYTGLEADVAVLADGNKLVTYKYPPALALAASQPPQASRIRSHKLCAFLFEGLLLKSVS